LPLTAPATAKNVEQQIPANLDSRLRENDNTEVWDSHSKGKSLLLVSLQSCGFAQDKLQQESKLTVICCFTFWAVAGAVKGKTKRGGTTD
jgi:hypothetical protein